MWSLVACYTLEFPLELDVSCPWIAVPCTILFFANYWVEEEDARCNEAPYGPHCAMALIQLIFLRIWTKRGMQASNPNWCSVMARKRASATKGKILCANFYAQHNIQSSFNSAQ